MIIADNFPYNNSFFRIFEELTRIPHGSGDTAEISKYCYAFAVKCGCDAVVDEAGNVIIKRPAGVGYENSQPVILQGHLDMVCEKTPDSSHDFTRDPLKLSFDGKYISALNTTLGGDDGVAVAFGLALVEDKDLQLPPLEILLTVDEETGLNGAIALDGSMLSGKALINLDSEEEGTLLCGCAGGVTARVSAEFKQKKQQGNALTVIVSGLAGGHSGVEIHKRRLNSAKTCARLLKSLDCEYNLISFSGGNKFNAIPRNSVAQIFVDDCERAVDLIKSEFDKLEVFSAEDKPTVAFKAERISQNALSNTDSKRIVEFIDGIIDGVLKESATGVVTSLNIGVSTYKNGVLGCETLIRSMDNADITEVAERVTHFADGYGFKCTLSDAYPAWEYNEISPLRDKMVSVYENIYGEKPIVATIHAGLECGIISEKIKGMDAVSIGPNVSDVHTVNERLDAESTVRTWNYLIEVLKSLK